MWFRSSMQQWGHTSGGHWSLLSTRRQGKLQGLALNGMSLSLSKKQPRMIKSNSVLIATSIFLFFFEQSKLFLRFFHSPNSLPERMWQDHHKVHAPLMHVCFICSYILREKNSWDALFVFRNTWTLDDKLTIVWNFS